MKVSPSFSNQYREILVKYLWILFIKYRYQLSDQLGTVVS